MSQPISHKAELVGVFGHPVAENPTIVMQEAAFHALDLDWRYLTIEVYPEDLAAAMAGLRAMNFRGINLTIPHKVEVLKYLDEVAPDAALIGAVNAKTKTPAHFVEWTSTYAVPAETDIVVNATSIGLFPAANAKPDLAYDTLAAHMIVCDVIPNPPRT